MYIVCILPEEWLAYSYDQLEDIIYEIIDEFGDVIIRWVE
ncbi:GSCOCT00014322001.2-RA-CDS [Cotesia congregata]|uniref:Cc_bv6.28_12.5_pseudo n=1 Tax=Cotesia congregata TaxID=51543 RepID=A0A8J2H2G7_COTCN|nr:GSCOCT00014322001.2-RA-CDS [Cotesia congregata]CAG5075262.1 cc_bv6.28_12.5_pseudo [Cotesia congregata]